MTTAVHRIQAREVAPRVPVRSLSADTARPRMKLDIGSYHQGSCQLVSATRLPDHAFWMWFAQGDGLVTPRQPSQQLSSLDLGLTTGPGTPFELPAESAQDFHLKHV